MINTNYKPCRYLILTFFVIMYIKEVREKTGLTQAEFAARLHISARTLQNWEQGRRYPTGPAATLIRILDAHPGLI